MKRVHYVQVIHRAAPIPACKLGLKTGETFTTTEKRSNVTCQRCLAFLRTRPGA